MPLWALELRLYLWSHTSLLLILVSFAASDPGVVLTPKGREKDNRRLSAANAAGHGSAEGQKFAPASG